MIRLEVDLTAVDRGLAALRARAADLAPAFRDLRKPLRVDIREHARAKEGPDNAWPAKSPFTLERERRARARAGRKRGGRRLLGRLPGALTIAADRTRVIAVSKARWSSVHQDGGKVGRGARVPARPFLWVSGKLRELARKRLEGHVLGGW